MINRIHLETDMHVEPGHQRLVLPYTDEGCALALLLTGEHYRDLVKFRSGSSLSIPHTEIVDTNIVQIIDALAHVRFSAPELLQLTLEE
jgi:hypothetical protein